ncbi:hypothetical protein HDV57DRAFT_316918 [Trichoderma longibrachiatum]|uniref:Uncharacterized protein n=1 Tax=Trichoderma longibrachiatum ATCC 18648 TaxID=983965 RepID=A0A2T4BZQ1_TRILO|nr:hypothetical protein M440DRAFT_345412 [Trichoderma longibrachiatum ATCC 18648]
MDPVAFVDDTDRSNWHTHCDDMDSLWNQYLQDIRPLVGDDYDPATLAKPSGAKGAILHIQWHYPTFVTKKTNHRFGHVLDPMNPSLKQQACKIGCPLTISVADMVPFRNRSRSPE